MFKITLQVVVLLLCVILASAADFYKVLDISRSADDATIKKAYRKLSRKYHPDKNKEPEAETRFVEIARAYEVLSDPEKRKIYDRHGEEGVQQHERGQGGGGANPFDLFQNFFGRRQPETRRGPTSTSDFEVTLENIYNGGEIDFMINKHILCDHCRGTGAASDNHIHTCPVCDGSGVQMTHQQLFPGMVIQGQTTCNKCGGKGKIIAKACPHCQGQKVMPHTQHYTLEIPRGAPEGHQVVFEAEGDENPDWEPGDVIISVRTRKRFGGWRRKETSLYWTENLSIQEVSTPLNSGENTLIPIDKALLGFERNITHIGGHTILLKRDVVTQPGFVQTIKDEGMPVFQGTGYGDLFIEYNVILPAQLPVELRKDLEQAFRKHYIHPKDEL